MPFHSDLFIKYKIEKKTLLGILGPNIKLKKFDFNIRNKLIYSILLEDQEYFMDFDNILEIPNNLSLDEVVTKSAQNITQDKLKLDLFQNFKVNEDVNFTQGLKIKISGRLNGVSMARKFSITEGKLKNQTINFNLKYKLKHINTK